MLEDIKLLLGITSADKDEVLQLLIRQATAEAKDFTGADDWRLENVISKMVIFNYNRMGTEGLNAESYAGASYTYADDYPESIKRELRRCRKLKTL